VYARPAVRFLLSTPARRKESCAQSPVARIPSDLIANRCPRPAGLSPYRFREFNSFRSASASHLSERRPALRRARRRRARARRYPAAFRALTGWRASRALLSMPGSRRARAARHAGAHRRGMALAASSGVASASIVVDSHATRLLYLRHGRPRPRARAGAFAHSTLDHHLYTSRSTDGTVGGRQLGTCAPEKIAFDARAVEPCAPPAAVGFLGDLYLATGKSRQRIASVRLMRRDRD